MNSTDNSANDKLSALRAKIAAAKAQAQGQGNTAPVAGALPLGAQSHGTLGKNLIPSEKIEALKTAEASAPATPSAVESTLLQISEEMREFPDFNPDAFVQKLAILEGQVVAKAPGIASYLQDINRNLRQYPELVHLLNDDQLAVITQGLLFLTNTNMVQIAASGKSRKTLSTEELTQAFGF